MDIKREGNRLTVTPEGKINIRTVDDFAAAFNDLEGITEIVVDMVNVDYISSSGLRVILMLQQKMNDVNGSVEYSNVQQAVSEVFRVSGFSSLLKIRK